MKAVTTPVTDEREGGTSASNAQADSLCQGRHQAQTGIPDEASEDAVFGQEIHDALLRDDPSKLKPDQQSIYDGCVEIRNQKLAEYFGDDVSKCKITKEQRYWCIVTKKFKHSAKPDFVARFGLRAMILEYKTLPGDVPESSTNEQLRDQAVLVSGNELVPEVAVGVIQPLVTYDTVLCVYDANALKEAQARMFKRVIASNDPAAKRTPHPVACKFCKARRTCQEYQVWSASTVPKTQSLTDVPMAHWTPEQCDRFCEMYSVASHWLELGKEEIKRRIRENPASVPGWTLVPGDTRRPVNDPNELHRRFLASGGTSEQFLTCVEINKGRLEGLTRTVTKLRGKQLVAKIEELLAGITTPKQNQPSLARKTKENEQQQLSNVDPTNAEAT